MSKFSYTSPNSLVGGVKFGVGVCEATSNTDSRLEDSMTAGARNWCESYMPLSTLIVGDNSSGTVVSSTALVLATMA